MLVSDNRSVFVGAGLIGVCPLLAKSTSLLGAGVMGMAFLGILLLSAISLSCCRRYIAYGLRLPAILMVSATWVLVLDLLMQAYWFDLRQVLGLYLPILAMNSFILLSLEQTALTRPPAPTLKAILAPGLLILGLCCCIGAGRELLGQAGLLSDMGVVLGGEFAGWSFADTGFVLFNKAPGAFLGLGLFIAACNRIAGRVFIGSVD